MARAAQTLSWNQRQQQFYGTRQHQHLQYVPNSRYAANIVRHVMAVAKLPEGGRVLEIGCGAGRFTIPFLKRFRGDLTAVDVSEELLAQLRRNLNMMRVPGQRTWRLMPHSIHELHRAPDHHPFDAVIGFFVLHHLDDLPAAFHSLRKLLRPGGQMVFITLCCPDMNFLEERGMFTLGRSKIRRACQWAGLSAPAVETFGWFPPQILDRWRWAFRIERAIERWPIVKPFLPFRLISTRRME